MKKLSTRQLWIIALIVDIILVAVFLFTNVINKSDPVVQQVSESNIRRICELASLECYYHNVSNWTQDAYGLFAFTGYGEKKIWIEYDGIVRVGINAGSVKISNPDKDDVITVTMPAAKVLDKDLDESTIKEITSDRTVLFFTDQVNSDDKIQALAAAQNDMLESASKNEMILSEAQDRAKKIIERNIVALGEAGGKHYKVKFVDATEAPKETQTEESP